MLGLGLVGFEGYLVQVGGILHGLVLLIGWFRQTTSALCIWVGQVDIFSDEELAYVLSGLDNLRKRCCAIIN